jgi:hypothetical protein
MIGLELLDWLAVPEDADCRAAQLRNSMRQMRGNYYEVQEGRHFWDTTVVLAGADECPPVVEATVPASITASRQTYLDTFAAGALPFRLDPYYRGQDRITGTAPRHTVIGLVNFLTADRELLGSAYVGADGHFDIPVCPQRVTNQGLAIKLLDLPAIPPAWFDDATTVPQWEGRYCSYRDFDGFRGSPIDVWVGILCDFERAGLQGENIRGEIPFEAFPGPSFDVSMTRPYRDERMPVGSPPGADAAWFEHDVERGVHSLFVVHGTDLYVYRYLHLYGVSAGRWEPVVDLRTTHWASDPNGPFARGEAPVDAAFAASAWPDEGQTVRILRGRQQFVYSYPEERWLNPVDLSTEWAGTNGPFDPAGRYQCDRIDAAWHRAEPDVDVFGVICGNIFFRFVTAELSWTARPLSETRWAEANGPLAGAPAGPVTASWNRYIPDDVGVRQQVVIRGSRQYAFDRAVNGWITESTLGRAY